VIAAQVCLDEGRCEQVLIVDLDVHQGDGSAALCQGRRDIITLSCTGAQLPRHKPASHLDFPLPSGMADDAYLTTLAEALNLALRLYTPTSSSIRPGSMCTRTTSLAISPER
jgi:acetoin utilization deacetylase AcuC-like enzyme